MASDKPLAGAKALITGAGTGIGKGIALAFVQAGASVAIMGRRKDVIDAAVKELSVFGQAVGIQGDVTSNADCEAAVKTASDALGGLSILVNNAGSGKFGPLTSLTPEEIESTIRVNLLGPVLMTRAALPVLEKSTGASILNISSCAANSVPLNFATYSSAKAGISHFTECMAKECAPKIRVNCINPGAVETPIFSLTMTPQEVEAALKKYAEITPLKRVGQPEDIANAAVYLSTAAWVTGTILVVDGGISFA